MIGIIVVLVGGYAFVQSARGRAKNDSLNTHEDQTVHDRADHPEGAERSHLVGNPPVDSITTEGWGVARPGEGAEPEELPEDVHPDLHDSDKHHRRG